MATNFPQAPGVYNGRSIQPRNIFKSGIPQFFPSFAFLDGSKSRDAGNSDSLTLLQAGVVLGKITASGKYRPTIIGITASTISAATVTSITVSAAIATEVARLISLAGGNVALKLIGPPTAGGTVATTSITCTAASGTTLTVSSVTVPAYAVGSIVAPADGSEAPSQFVTAPYGVDVLDINGNAIDAPVQLLRNGDIKTTDIVGYSSLDTSVQTWLKAAMRTNNPGAVLTFSDDR